MSGDHYKCSDFQQKYSDGSESIIKYLICNFIGTKIKTEILYHIYYLFIILFLNVIQVIHY